MGKSGHEMNSIDIDEKTAFLDTNILLYSIDGSDEKKQEQARSLIQTLMEKGAPVISTQVLMEFYNASVSKLKIDKVSAKYFVDKFSKMRVVTVDVPMIKRAIDTCILYQLSQWDALIVSAAEYAKCSLLITEDLSHEQLINGVKIVNPFILKNS